HFRPRGSRWPNYHLPITGLPFSDRHLLDDLESVPVQADDIARAVRQQPDFAEAERGQDLRADAVVAEIHRRRWLARLGLEAFHQRLARVRRLHVEHDTA